MLAKTVGEHSIVMSMSEYVCLYLSVSQGSCPNFSKYCKHVACGSILLWSAAISLILMVLWMMSYLHIMDPQVMCSYCSSTVHGIMPLLVAFCPSYGRCHHLCQTSRLCKGYLGWSLQCTSVVHSIILCLFFSGF